MAESSFERARPRVRAGLPAEPAGFVGREAQGAGDPQSVWIDLIRPSFVAGFPGIMRLLV